MDSNTELPIDSLRLRNWQTDVVYIYIHIVILTVCPASVIKTIFNVCNLGCAAKTIQGTCCRFPFKYRGKVYRQCTRVGSHRPWCFTAAKKRGKRLKWGYCAGRMKLIRSVIVLNHISLCCLPLTHAFIFSFDWFFIFWWKIKTDPTLNILQLRMHAHDFTTATLSVAPNDISTSCYRGARA